MNYLAHLLLSDPDPDALIGSLMGDFVKGRVDDALVPGIRRGILLHRRIDSFTDGHAVFRRSKRRLGPDFRRYAGILIDVYFDHFLARRWNRFADSSLDDFADAIYAIVDARQAALPPRMRRSMAYMIENNLLVSYREIDGVGRALRGIETRLKRPSRLGDAVRELERDYDGFGADFDAFFPQLVEFVTAEDVSGAGADGDRCVRP